MKFIKSVFTFILLISIANAVENNKIVLMPGSTAIVKVDAPTLVQCLGKTQARLYTCTLNYTSTYGEEMPQITAEGDTREIAMERIKQACGGVGGYGNASKCASFSGTAKCTFIIE